MTPLRTTKARFKTTRSLRVSPQLTLELAVTAEQRAQGLMGRAVLQQQTGMLFIFDKPGKHGFWMKNTGIPLDIAWLSPAGVVQEVAQLFAYDERMRSPKQEAKYAIELPAGSFDSYDVRVGDQLVLVGGAA